MAASALPATFWVVMAGFAALRIEEQARVAAPNIFPGRGDCALGAGKEPNDVSAMFGRFRQSVVELLSSIFNLIVLT